MKYWGEVFLCIKMNFCRAAKLEDKYPHSETLRRCLEENKRIFDNFFKCFPNSFICNTLGIELWEVRAELKRSSADADCWKTLNYEGENFLPSEKILRDIQNEEYLATHQGDDQISFDELLAGDQITFDQFLGIRNKKGSVKDLLT